LPAVLQDQGVPVLAEAVRKVEDEGLSVALLQVVSNIAELPLCRNGLLAECMARVLEGIAAEAASPRTRAAAKRALRGVLFEHWPQ
jgi:ribosomal protein S12 methylthiotransferase accessory factor YcaO